MFLGDDFLLDTPTAVELYHDFAATLPIYDYHCHLPAGEIADNKQYGSITEIWLGGDHYKWRALRANGVPERLITGDGGAWEKFDAWAATLPAAIGNPLCQWTHLELRRYFGIDELLTPRSARAIYDRCNQLLATEEFRAHGLMKGMNVRLVCTTDDPADDLEHHRRIAADANFPIPVFPAFRPDKAFRVDDPDAWNSWVDRLAAASGREIRRYDDLLSSLSDRVDYFHARGCRVSDHGIYAPFPPGSAPHAGSAFDLARRGTAVSPADAERFAGALLSELAGMYHRNGWVMQIHLGALRNNSTRMFRKLGADTGYDAIGDPAVARNLVGFLDGLDTTDSLPKTIVYSLNPRDNELLASICGSYQDGITPGKMQLGSGWWFNDQRDGMERQMTALANIGLLGRFVGMTTDSRSFLSYPRHEYFRRVLCRLLGRWVASGEIPREIDMLGDLVADISYRNAEAYFGMTRASSGEPS